MLFNEFEALVNYAVGGKMVDSEVCDITSQLKEEKDKIVRAISKLPDGAERRTAFAKLHTLMYKLYDAKVDAGNDTYKERGIIANMVLCYDCK